MPDLHRGQLGTRLASCAILGALLLGCGSRGYQSVSLSPGEVAATDFVKGTHPLRIGLAPILSIDGAGEGLAMLSAALSRKLGRPVHPLVGSDYREINDMLGLGQLEVGIICAGAYADQRLNKVCEPLLIPLLTGTGSTYQSYIVVKEEDPSRRLEDLHGASFAFTDSLSLTGYIYPVARLSGLGWAPGTFFSRVSFSHSHDRSLAMVLEGTVRAAAVDSSVFKAWVGHHTHEARKLRVLEQSEFFPSPPIVVQASLQPQEKAILQRAFLDLAESEDGKAILAKIGWTGFQIPDARWHKGMEHLDHLFRTLRAKNSLPS
jgi:phosphonate transport system substrate-binding protein